MELRQAFADVDDLVVLYVLPAEQINPKTLRFIEELGLRRRVVFLADPGSRSIESLGLLLPDPEPIEAGVPHPTTYLLDPDGRVRLVDVREDYHVWLDPTLVLRALP